MALQRPANTAGLRHVALFSANLEASVDFYTRLIGMEVEWQPDPDNFYLTSGVDNLALHRLNEQCQSPQQLDHIGFILKTPEEVDLWYDWLVQEGVRIKAKPRVHRDGAKSFYCLDPDGIVVQMIYHPPIADCFPGADVDTGTP